MGKSKCECDDERPCFCYFDGLEDRIRKLDLRTELSPSWDTIDEMFRLINDCRLRINILEDKMAHPSGKKQTKIKKVMKEFEKGELHSGSKKGPVVKDKAQALAIGYSEAKKKK